MVTVKTPIMTTDNISHYVSLSDMSIKVLQTATQNTASFITSSGHHDCAAQHCAKNVLSVLPEHIFLSEFFFTMCIHSQSDIAAAVSSVALQLVVN